MMYWNSLPNMSDAPRARGLFELALLLSAGTCNFVDVLRKEMTTNAG